MNSPNNIVDLSQDTYLANFSMRSNLFQQESEGFVQEVVRTARLNSVGRDDPTLVIFYHPAVAPAVKENVRTALVNRGGIPSKAEPDRIISFREWHELVNARNEMRVEHPDYFTLSHRLANQLGVAHQVHVAETVVITQSQRQMPDVASYQFFLID